MSRRRGARAHGARRVRAHRRRGRRRQLRRPRGRRPRTLEEMVLRSAPTSRAIMEPLKAARGHLRLTSSVVGRKALPLALLGDEVRGHGDARVRAPGLQRLPRSRRGPGRWRARAGAVARRRGWGGEDLRWPAPWGAGRISCRRGCGASLLGSCEHTPASTPTCGGWLTASRIARATSSGYSASRGAWSKNGVSTMPGSIRGLGRRRAGTARVRSEPSDAYAGAAARRRLGGMRSVIVPSAISAAKPTVSESVGCGWIVSAEVLGVGAHLDREHGLGDQLARVRADDPGPEDALRLGVDEELGHPSSRPIAARARRRPRGTTPSRTRCPSALASSRSGPSRRPRDPCRRRTGSSAASKRTFSPAITSAATLPSCVALWASIGSPTTSPIAKMCADVGALLRVDAR